MTARRARGDCGHWTRRGVGTSVRCRTQPGFGGFARVSAPHADHRRFLGLSTSHGRSRPDLIVVRRGWLCRRGRPADPRDEGRELGGRDVQVAGSEDRSRVDRRHDAGISARRSAESVRNAEISRAATSAVPGGRRTEGRAVCSPGLHADPHEAIFAAAASAGPDRQLQSACRWWRRRATRGSLRYTTGRTSTRDAGTSPIRAVKNLPGRTRMRADASIAGVA